MPAPSYGSVPRALAGPAAGQLGGRGGSWGCRAQGPGCLARPSGGHGASTGAFWPEEVTEKQVGASESPGNSRRGRTLLLPRAGQVAACLHCFPGTARLQSRAPPKSPRGAREGLWPCPGDAPEGERLAQAPGRGPQQPPRTEGRVAAAFLVAHGRPVPSVQCLRASREERCPTLEYCWPAWGRGR